MNRLIAFGLLGVSLLGVALRVLPTSGIDWVFLAAFCLGGVAALRQGRDLTNVAFLVAAAILIQSFINILSLSPITKVVNGVLFLVAVWRFPDGLDMMLSWNRQNEADETTGTSRKTPPSDGKKAAQSVFEDFKAFTRFQQGDGGESAEKTASKPEKKKRGGGSHSRRGSGARHGSSGHSKSRHNAKPPEKQEEKPRRGRRHSGSRRRSDDKKKPDLSKAQAALQAEQHAVQQEKQRLEEERQAVERRRRAEEARLRREREALEKEKAALKDTKPAKQVQPDNRSPEEVLGLNKPNFTFQELKDARKREVARWHTSSMGNKPKDLVELAEEELKKINLAYDRLKKKFE